MMINNNDQIYEADFWKKNDDDDIYRQVKRKEKNINGTKLFIACTAQNALS